MHDEETTIRQLRDKMQKFIDDRKWGTYHYPKELAVALNIEASELLELFLFQDYSLDDIKSDEKLYGHIKDEAADILAYLLSIVNCLGMDLTSAFVEKMKKNDQKYPTSRFYGNYEKQ